jgi:hypothetical protein
MISRQSVPKFEMRKSPFFGKGQAVRQRAFQVARGFARGLLEMLRAILRDDPLGAVGGNPDQASSRIGGP